MRLPARRLHRIEKRFAADAKIKNTGNVGIVARVRATWAQIGGRPIKDEKTVKVPCGGSKKVGFLRVATQDEIDRHPEVAAL